MERATTDKVFPNRTFLFNRIKDNINVSPTASMDNINIIDLNKLIVIVGEG
jgi:hypothetical protein